MGDLDLKTERARLLGSLQSPQTRLLLTLRGLAHAKSYEGLRLVSVLKGVLEIKKAEAGLPKGKGEFTSLDEIILLAKWRT